MHCSLSREVISFLHERVMFQWQGHGLFNTGATQSLLYPWVRHPALHQIRSHTTMFGEVKGVALARSSGSVVLHYGSASL